VARPILLGRYISVIEPPPMLRQGLQKSPAKKRQTRMLAIFFDTAHPMMKSPPSGRLQRYTGSRPYCSLTGLPMTGPRERPTQKSETPSSETVSETLYSFAAGAAPLAHAEDR
jgi:hypothetical protein